MSPTKIYERPTKKNTFSYTTNRINKNLRKKLRILNVTEYNIKEQTDRHIYIHEKRILNTRTKNLTLQVQLIKQKNAIKISNSTITTTKNK